MAKLEKKRCPVCGKNYSERKWKDRRLVPSGYAYRHWNDKRGEVNWCQSYEVSPKNPGGESR